MKVFNKTLNIIENKTNFWELFIYIISFKMQFQFKWTINWIIHFNTKSNNFFYFNQCIFKEDKFEYNQINFKCNLYWKSKLYLPITKYKQKNNYICIYTKVNKYLLLLPLLIETKFEMYYIDFITRSYLNFFYICFAS